MKVLDAYNNLKVLIDAGKGDLDLVCRDTRSGETSYVDIYDDSVVIEDQEQFGVLCDEEIGYEYVSVYI